LASFHSGHPLFFSCTRRMGDFRLGRGRSSSPPDRGLAFSKVPLTTPFLTSLLAARVAFRRWLPPSQDGEPFASESSQFD
jgi:hypothetical protein